MIATHCLQDFTNNVKHFDWTVYNSMLHPWLLYMSAYLKASLIFCVKHNMHIYGHAITCAYLCAKAHAYMHMARCVYEVNWQNSNITIVYVAVLFISCLLVYSYFVISYTSFLSLDRYRDSSEKKNNNYANGWLSLTRQWLWNNNMGRHFIPNSHYKSHGEYFAKFLNTLE